MTTITSNITLDLDQRFRNKVVEKIGMKKGNLSIAVQEALELWIRQN